jgi:hypothetical protein
MRDMTAQIAAVAAAVAERINTAPYVRVDLHTEQIMNLRSEVGSLRQIMMWLLGLLVSAIVGAIVVLVITAGRGAAV